MASTYIHLPAVTIASPIAITGTVTITPTPNPNINNISVYNEVSAVASGSETLLVSYTITPGKIGYLQHISAAGGNIAQFKIKLNSNYIDQRYTNFGSDLTTDFRYDGEMNPGLRLVPGDSIQVYVLQMRPYSADFNSKIQLIEV